MDTCLALSGAGDPVVASLKRLLAVTATDTGQARSVASFLLAWDNAYAYGGFDPTEFWAVSAPVRTDTLEVIGLIARERYHPAAYGHQDAFAALVLGWRPDMAAWTQ